MAALSVSQYRAVLPRIKLYVELVDVPHLMPQSDACASIPDASHLSIKSQADAFKMSQKKA